MEDVVVIGGGPAGLSAALWLGRYRRRTLVVDSGTQRNLATFGAHGYLTRDGITPQGFLDAARADVARYDSVHIVRDEVVGVERAGDDFTVTTKSASYRAHRVMLATGVKDVFPDIDGFDELYGKAIFHCSCCDGYEARGRKVVAIGWGDHAAGFALDLLDWGAEVTLLTDGRDFQGDEACRVVLARYDVEIVQDEVAEIISDGAAMTGIRLLSGRTIDCSNAFFSIAHEPRVELAVSVGCELDDGGYIRVDEHGLTSVPGVYAAGDMTPGEQLIQNAAAKGAIAGIACAMSLRGMRTASSAPRPGPDPQAEL